MWVDNAIQDVEIEQYWICAVLWWPFWKWRPVEIFRCRESILDVEIEQCWICAVLWIDTRHCKISTGRHFQNGHHNTAQIQHCPISTTVTYHYVKFYVSIIIHLEVININVQNFNFPIGFYSNRPISSRFDMWVDNDVPNWFPTLKNVYRPPFSKWPPVGKQFRTLESNNVEFVRYCGGHFENGDR
jgi:hypothetical protein